jgi:hypothetical protein
MMGLSKEYDKEFARRFWKGFFIAIAAGFGIAFILVMMGLIAMYGRQYNF